ncbi:hypothetical protein ADT26_00985 [Xanthomonas oryzae]|nr:hypothetical protein AXO1947_01955 [Xanthomonas oryzae pv. oryzae]KOR48589.1 hypothetical protein ADT26_00985 [Xanthomonas oryzae]AUI91950.1 hypothetical protein BVV16_20475 [Xanthomonas oryzae pv. oryzae]AUI95627.1 hypothetical protein BVV17_20505 [Xanthomonas oryzae pv. oryzae]AUI99298.1 hypothetical protein BVV18_20505 [Xanthomonas oryzae pv. oryzae]
MPNNAVKQVVKAAVVEVPRALHFDDLRRIGHTVAQTIEREPGIGLLMLSTADGRASAEQSSLDVDGRRLAALAEVIATLDRLGWHAVPDLAATALPQSLSCEALFFALPEHLRPALPAVEPSHALQLRQWPELSAETSSPAQLLAIAHLHARPWRPQALASACKLPLQTVECLFAAALASGLAQTAESPVPATPRRPDSGNTRFFSWVARRFGLALFQAQS